VGLTFFSLNHRVNDNEEEELEDTEELVDLSDTLVLLNEHVTPSLNSLVYDVLFRPTALENISMWDQFALYEKIRIGKGKHEDDVNDEDDEPGMLFNAYPLFAIINVLFAIASISQTDGIHQFVTGHPQQSTHCLRKRKVQVIPVLSGTPIPRRDIEEQDTKYAIAMLALFRPWSRSESHPLKSETISWKEALADLLIHLPQDKLKIINHMQEQWECRLAADDFSAQYRSHLVQFNATKGIISTHADRAEELTHDLDWQLGQLDEAIGPEYNANSDSDDIIDPSSSEFLETCGTRTKLATNQAIQLAEAANFYYVAPSQDNFNNFRMGQAIESTFAQTGSQAHIAARLIAEQRAVALKDRQRGMFETDYNYHL
jgi:hypothetical protein